MVKFTITLQLLALLCPALAVTSETHSENAIYRDVAIIGGGSSGTYAAIRLRDQGKSVVVVEKEPRLGGDTNTYREPITNQTIDYGVVVFHNQNITKDYFRRLNVSYTTTSPFGSTGGETHYLDAQTGDPVNFTPPDPEPGLKAYKAHLSNYSALEHGFFLPNPVPEDLLLPFGQFVAKYPAITDATYTIFNYGQGLGDFLSQPTLYVFKNFGLSVLRNIENGFLVVSSGNNHEIYDKAAEVLGPDVLLSSEVTYTPRRTSRGVTVLVSTPTGHKVIHAKKLLLAIPQKLEKLVAFAPDPKESALFAQFMNTGYYTSLVQNTCLPGNFSSSSASANGARYHLPQMPGIYGVASTKVDGIFDVKYGSPHSLPDSYVKSQILGYIRNLQENGFGDRDCGEPQFVAYRSHAPFELTVSPWQISGGFYRDLYDLQGHKGTWYTGAAFDTQDSSLLWRFTEEVVLPGLLK